MRATCVRMAAVSACAVGPFGKCFAMKPGEAVALDFVAELENIYGSIARNPGIGSPRLAMVNKVPIVAPFHQEKILLSTSGTPTRNPAARGCATQARS